MSPLLMCPPPLWIPLGLWPVCFLRLYKFVDRSQYLSVFSALLHSPNGPLNIFIINLLHIFLSLSTLFLLMFFYLEGYLLLGLINLFTWLLTILEKIIKNQQLYSGVILDSNSYALENPDSVFQTLPLTNLHCLWGPSTLGREQVLTGPLPK